MRLGKALFFALLLLVGMGASQLAFAYGEEEISPLNLHLAMKAYLDDVLTEARYYFPRWAEDLMERASDEKFPGIRRHAAPIEETKLQESIAWWQHLWRQPVKRPSTEHLRIIHSIALEARERSCLRYFCGKLKYPWTEKNLSEFHRIVAERLGDLVHEFDLRVQWFHEDRRPPSHFELEKLMESYLEIWVLGAVLESESKLFLTAFPLAFPHRERLREEHEPVTNSIGECRVAILLMADPNYRW